MKNTLKKAIAIVLTVIMVGAIIVPNAAASQSKSENFSKSFTLTGNQADDIAAVAAAQIGKTKSNLGYTEAWCADFVCDCAKLAGISDSVVPYNYGSRGAVSALYIYMLDYCGATKVTTPQKGDFVFYYCTTDNNFCHVGIMVDSTNSIQGNVDSSVKKLNYSYYRDVYYNYETGSGGTCYNVDFVRPAYSSSGTTTNRPDAPQIIDLNSNYNANETFTVKWTKIENNVTHYNVCVEVYNGERYVDYNYWRELKGTSVDISLPAGKYRVITLAYNSNYWEDDGSDWLHSYYSVDDYVYFTVSNNGVISELQRRYNELVNVFPNGSYFTTTGKASSGSDAAECWYPDVARSKGFDWYSMHSSWSCCGYAHFAFRYLFWTEFTWSDTVTSKSITTINTSSLNSFFADCKFGDVIEINYNGSKYSGQHWFMFTGYSAGDKVYFNDCNTSGECMVHLGTSWSYSFMTNNISSMKRYHANNYDEISGGQPITNRPDLPQITGLKSKYSTSDTITFNWTKIESNVTHYNFYIEAYNGSAYEYYQSIYELKDTSYTVSRLPEGKYRVMTLAYNSNYWEDDGSDWLHSYYSVDDYVYFTVSSHSPGDINGDGAMDNKDVVVLFRYVSGGSEYDSKYDFNGDNEVNNKDVVALFREVSKA